MFFTVPQLFRNNIFSARQVKEWPWKCFESTFMRGVSVPLCLPGVQYVDWLTSVCWINYSSLWYSVKIVWHTIPSRLSSPTLGPILRQVQRTSAAPRLLCTRPKPASARAYEWWATVPSHFGMHCLARPWVWVGPHGAFLDIHSPFHWSSSQLWLDHFTFQRQDLDIQKKLDLVVHVFLTQFWATWFRQQLRQAWQLGSGQGTSPHHRCPPGVFGDILEWCSMI